MIEFLQNNIATILGFIIGGGGLLDSFLQRKKRKADAMDGMQSAYKKFIEDSTQRYNDLDSKLDQSNKRHQREMAELKSAHSSEIANLKENWSLKYDNLRLEFDNYKKLHP